MDESETVDNDGLGEKMRRMNSNTKNPLRLNYINRRLELGVEEGNCTHFINRKKRYCTHRVVSGSTHGKCSEHTDEALLESRLRDEQHRLRQENSDKQADGSNPVRAKRVSAPKRMANPFSTDLTPPVDPLFDWNVVFVDPSKPLHIDVGCAKGRCIARLSQKPERAGWNQLGLEIRDSIVQHSIAHLTAEDKVRRNLHFLTNNFAATAEDLLRTLPAGVVRLVSFQFPDPWRREKHSKRLIVQLRLIDTLAAHMTEGACVYLSSDCENIAAKMRQTFEKHSSSKQYFRLLSTVEDLGFETSTLDAEISAANKITPHCFIRKPVVAASTAKEGGEMEDGWIKFNPLDEPSERELVCEVDWKRVWRCVFVRTDTAFTAADAADAQLAEESEQQGQCEGSDSDDEGHEELPQQENTV